MTVLREAAPEEQLALIRAHPELAGKAAVDGTLTDASAAEQASVGLDRMTRAEFDRFHALNDNFRAIAQTGHLSRSDFVMLAATAFLVPFSTTRRWPSTAPGSTLM